MAPAKNYFILSHHAFKGFTETRIKTSPHKDSLSVEGNTNSNPDHKEDSNYHADSASLSITWDTISVWCKVRRWHLTFCLGFQTCSIIVVHSINTFHDFIVIFCVLVFPILISLVFILEVVFMIMSVVISTEDALELPTTYDNHPIQPIPSIRPTNI